MDNFGKGGCCCFVCFSENHIEHAWQSIITWLVDIALVVLFFMELFHFYFKNSNVASW